MLTLLNKFATLGCTRAPVWFRQVKTAIPIFVLTTTVLRNPEYGYLLLIIPTPRIGFFSFPDLGDLRNNRKKVQESGTFKKNLDFLHQTQTLKPLPIGQGNKSLGAKCPFIGGRLCTTPYKNGA